MSKRRNANVVGRESAHEIVTQEPEALKEVRNFIAETEGQENPGGDPRAGEKTKTSLTERELKRQDEAMRRFKERGYRTEEEG